MSKQVLQHKMGICAGMMFRMASGQLFTDSRARHAAIAALKTMQHFSRLDIAALTSLRSSFTALLQSCTLVRQRCSLSDFSVAVDRLTTSVADTSL